MSLSQDLITKTGNPLTRINYEFVSSVRRVVLISFYWGYNTTVFLESGIFLLETKFCRLSLSFLSSLDTSIYSFFFCSCFCLFVLAETELIYTYRIGCTISCHIYSFSVCCVFNGYSYIFRWVVVTINPLSVNLVLMVNFTNRRRRERVNREKGPPH